jgi:dipeptide transport system ATP-binding protein
MALLEIDRLSVRFGDFSAVDGLSLSLDKGEVLGIVGESGSGKSVSMLAMMGLIGWPGVIEADGLRFDGHDLLGISDAQRRSVIGKDMAMIFQEPMTSLNPCYTAGYQIMEAIRVHQGGNRRELREQAMELLDQVGIPDPRRRMKAFPHQLSGGMNQRVMIAMAIACNPRLLIADEPTTALDVTIQAQILDLLLALQQQRGMALVLITHDMGVVAETAQRVAVMYAGQKVEEQPVEILFERPAHPYTKALLEALPERARGKRRLPTIPGVVPGAQDRISGCRFHPRCRHADDRCRREPPPWDPQTRVRCFKPEPYDD